MGATAAQIASARQIAQQRGYDPNLVTADNADRVQTAFPVQNKAGASGGGAQKTVDAPPPVDKGLSSIAGLTPSPAPATPISTAIPSGPIGGTAGAPAATPGGGGMAVDSGFGGTPAPTPGVPSVESLMGAGGSGGDAGGAEVPSMGGLLRPLGQRSPTAPSFDLAQRGRRVY